MHLHGLMLNQLHARTILPFTRPDMSELGRMRTDNAFYGQVILHDSVPIHISASRDREVRALSLW
jgi:hypothetical protein